MPVSAGSGTSNDCCDYQGDLHGSKTAGDTATFTWNGTSATIYGEKTTDGGLDGITLDGVAQPSVNTTAVGLVQQPIYSVTGLTAGIDKIVLTHLTGNYMTIDKAAYQ